VEPVTTAVLWERSISMPAPFVRDVIPSAENSSLISASRAEIVIAVCGE